MASDHCGLDVVAMESFVLHWGCGRAALDRDGFAWLVWSRAGRDTLCVGVSFEFVVVLRELALVVHNPWLCCTSCPVRVSSAPVRII